MSAPDRFDLAVIGAGPVGSTAACLAARQGLSCLLVDESVEVFPLPRAIHFDADVMRIFQFAGLAERIEPLTRATTGGEHLGVDGEPIRRFRVSDKPGDLGWRPHYMFFQPQLDGLLREAAAAATGVDARFGWRCEGVEQTAEDVEITLDSADGEETVARARYVIAADGAASPTRRGLDIRLSDYDFDEPWVIVDGTVSDPEMGPDHTIMYCDPARPGTYVPGPRRHRRWEFMLLPGEDAGSMSDEATVRGLIDPITPWLSPADLDVERVAVYRFHALVAERWRAGRVFLAGDAAHQTPPFYGQGMCHGIRDVRNLIWKLDAVRAGHDDSLLDTYQEEREPHVRAVIEAAVANGRYICTLDPELAAKRDRELREKMGQGTDVRSFREVIPGLTTGLLDRDSGNDAVGLLFVQPPITAGGDDVRLDDLIGDRFALVSSLALAPSPELAAFEEEIGGRLLTIGEDIEDMEGTLAAWFETFGCSAALVRPDRYVYGVATTAADVEPLVAGFRRAFGAPVTEAAA